MMKNYQITILLTFLLIFKIINGLSQNRLSQIINDSLKIDEKYQENWYSYSGFGYEIFQNPNSTRDMAPTYTLLKIDSIKRLYRVHNISIWKNFDGKKFYLIEISDYSNSWYWTIISEYSKRSCKNKIKKNRLYFMEIVFFEGEKKLLRDMESQALVKYQDDYYVYVNDFREKHQFVFSPNINGRCFYPF